MAPGLGSAANIHMAAPRKGPATELHNFADLSQDKLHFVHQELLVARNPLLGDDEDLGAEEDADEEEEGDDVGVDVGQIIKSGSFRRRKVRENAAAASEVNCHDFAPELKTGGILGCPSLLFLPSRSV